MASGDATVFPIKNTAYRVYFPLLDADGDLVTGGASDTPDTERSLDGGTFADCSNEMVEVATNSGMYFLDLNASEMNTDCTLVIAKTAAAGTKTTPLVLYTVDKDPEVKADSDMLLIQSDLSDIISELIVLDNAISDVESSLVVVKSDLVVVTTDVGSLSTKQDSDMVVVAADHTKTQSDIVILDDFLDNEISDIHSRLVVIQSETTVIASDAIVLTTDVAALSTKQDSDMVVVAQVGSDIESSLVIAKSDLVISNSDTAQIGSDLIIAASDIIIIGSDLVLIDNAVSDVESSLVIVKSDLTVIDAAESDVLSELLIVKSDLVVIDDAVSDIESSLVIVKSDLVVIESDTTRMELGIVTGVAEAGTLSTTQMTTDLTESTNDHWIGKILTWTSGVLLGQSTDLTDSVGANGLLTYTQVTDAPSAADKFKIT